MNRPTVLAYYFPGWHPDERLSARYGEGWTEWQLLQNARPRFAGHRQPRVPADGYLNESDPGVMAGKIDLAADHGVDAFVFDFYWHDDGPFLEGALDRGYLGAANRERVEFALMWANHDWVEIFPADHGNHEVLRRGPVGRAAFDAMVDHVIERYFSQPEYLRIDGQPFYSIYEIGSFIEGLGGVDEARDALEDFRRKTIAAGHPGLYLDATVWGFGVLPGAVTTAKPEDLIRTLGFASASSYVWVHHSDISAKAFPEVEWDAVADDAFAAYAEYAAALSVPLIPNVTVGWDSSPRTDQNLPFEPVGYPWYPVLDATPAQFERGLRRAVELLDGQRLSHPMLTINAWNEWTEGSALEPDTERGTEYLEAILNVLGTATSAVETNVA
ncbi:MAG: glycoside hydrolase family 99-like domain-containing protein [Kineosporiaceae bacterium]|nr:glycoside hydrolase family 99-like domain-containing protein [Aeromicrobium sp.]